MFACREEMFPGLLTEANTPTKQSMRLIFKNSLLKADMEVFIHFNGEQSIAWV
jgi:hypothetical protein